LAKKYNRAILATVSDSHGGHNLGLLNPETQIEEEDREGNIYYKPVVLNDVQEYLWEVYENSVAETKKFAGKDPIFVKHIGDINQGNIFPREQIGTRISDQTDIGFSLFLPWMTLPNLKAVRIVKGTSSHNFGEGSAEILTARLLRAHYPKVDVRVLSHGLATISQVVIDYAHHGASTGSRNWLKGNEARYYLRSIMMDEIMMGNIPPDLVLRGHYHEPISELVTIRCDGHKYSSWIYILPSMAMIDTYGRQATRSKYVITNGIVLFEIINGKIHDTIELTKTLDIRTKEILL